MRFYLITEYGNTQTNNHNRKSVSKMLLWSDTDVIVNEYTFDELRGNYKIVVKDSNNNSRTTYNNYEEFVEGVKGKHLKELIGCKFCQKWVSTETLFAGEIEMEVADFGEGNYSDCNKAKLLKLEIFDYNANKVFENDYYSLHNLLKATEKYKDVRYFINNIEVTELINSGQQENIRVAKGYYYSSLLIDEHY